MLTGEWSGAELENSVCDSGSAAPAVVKTSTHNKPCALSAPKERVGCAFRRLADHRCELGCSVRAPFAPPGRGSTFNRSMDQLSRGREQGRDLEVSLPPASRVQKANFGQPQSESKVS